VTALTAQTKSPATWSVAPEQQKARPGSGFYAQLRLKLEEPWHMYSMTTPPPGPNGGPIATTIKVADAPWIAGAKVYAPAPQRKFDPNFGIDTETYDKEVTFWIEIDVAKDAPPGEQEFTVATRAQFCTDKECLPPKRTTTSGKIVLAADAAGKSGAIPAGWLLPAAPAALATAQKATPQGFGTFLLVAFGFGLAAIFTPCVFPMIPITMSFFMEHGRTTRGHSILQAALFCLGIVFLFTAMGLGVTVIFGPFAVVQLGSDPWVNGLISLVFFTFGLSLLGAFEITIPSGFLNKLTSISTRGNLLGTLLLGLTFSLTSFACVGPFVGTLLAASVQGSKLEPIFGMIAFASGLAAPFFLLALFPGYLHRLPRSGAWLARVKVVMGFLILAAMLKYLSNIDQVLQWNILTRERFLGAWVVLFALAGLYLLGLLRLEGIKADDKLGVSRLLVASVLLTFALSLVPGMFGVKLGEIEAYVPAVAGEKSDWMKNDLAGAIERAKAEHKLILVSFTGYACTNCHWMKANMFPKPEVAGALKDLVLVELYTDGTDAVSEKNQELQNRLFKTVALPFYAILTPEEKAVATFEGLTKDARQFTAFLRSGARA